jgi:GWxTD domain-containing protein
MAAGGAQAQAPEGSATLTPAAVAESLAVLKTLDAALGKNSKDAATWHRRGMLAWALYERDRVKPPIAGLDWTRLGPMADSSLRLAAEFDRTNAQYRLMAGRFLLSSGVSITRAASYHLFTDALDAARKNPDPHVHADAAIETGRLHWRRYDSDANQWNYTQVGCNVDSVANGAGVWTFDSTGHNSMQGVRVWRSFISPCFVPMANADGYPGEADYIQAETFFREAFEAQPTFDRAYRQFAMLLVDKNRWTELAATAQARLKVAPWDAWAWLTLGLAMHRQGGRPAATTAAFDSAFALLSPDEHKRLDRLERVVKPGDSTRVAQYPAATRAALERIYWMSADPLWSREGNEPHVEFLARVTYAELRWTVEELKVRGADTDRGDVHIRFGPADFVMSICTSYPNLCNQMPKEPLIRTIWAYNNGIVFEFKGLLTFATASIPPDAQQWYGDQLKSTPVRWDNLRSITVDTMPVQAARFRAPGDSVDIVVATEPPIAAIRSSSDVAGPVRADFWLLFGGVNAVAHDTVASTNPGPRIFTHRVAPGAYVYRAEASADGARYAARASAALLAGADSATGFAARGFGISDVLVAERATARTGSAARWSDLALVPLAGSTARGSEITLIWENYDLADERGSSRYTIAIALQRQQKALGRIAAQIVSRVGGAVGVNRTDDRLTMQYDRSVAHTPVVLDNVVVSLGETPAGTYRLTLQILDRVSGKTTSRTMNLTVREK